MRYCPCDLRIQSRGRGIHSYKTIMYVLFINKYKLFSVGRIGSVYLCPRARGQNEWGEKLSE